ncbi:hypothetical protein EDB81DRAFT_692772 [Dactylonectria macrodidyma]|uniref:Actin-like ATPase domain-containing protein n=1 Tax=Dactylonectria macrodidyma TaxID=307937 RepID=A0A9P9EPT2_9HYPO|nr:hypothetical protein EDB81DRAFT_692772 [Dactylonectria macrodidyma]
MATLVIGLDFGTTYTGVAYCDDTAAQKGTSEIRLVDSWPGTSGSNNTNAKVPSRICYDPPPTANVTWGNRIRPDSKGTVHALMKLKLDEKMKGSANFRLLLAFLTSNMGGLDLDDVIDGDNSPPEYPGKSPVDLVADYLSRVREHTWKHLETEYGPAMLDSMKKELVVTVPAVWSERAKDQTLKAVQRANFIGPKGQICMVTEPEAAAIYTLKSMAEMIGMMRGSNSADLEVGDVLVLTDCGGGTVDLISYKITQVHPVFRVEEAAVGTGDKCGATYVEKEFLAWLEQWIGSDRFKKIPDQRKRHGSQMMSQFEENKFRFDGEDDDMEVRLPKECNIKDEESLNIEDQVLSLKTDQMKKLFDPCVNRTLELIDGQVASVMKAGLGKPKMVIVVGGFGRNAYLYKKIEEYAQARGIQTRRPKNPWSAVARGAVCRGLETSGDGLVTVRLARKFYGTPTSTPYIAGIHHEDDAYIDEYTGRKYAKGQMNWLIEKGDRLPEGNNPKTLSIRVCSHFTAGEDRSISAVLVGCSEDSAPKRFADDSAVIVCRVRGDLSDIDLKTLPKARKPNGEEYWEIDFELQATLKADVILWKALYKGKQVGETTVSYDD